MKKDNFYSKGIRKGYTIIELIVVIVIMTILGMIISKVYTYYISKGLEEKRINIVKTYGISLSEIIGREGDIPLSYCTNDGGTTYNSSCFLANGCTGLITCNVGNNYCKTSGSYYYDFNKLISDYGYGINSDLKFTAENMPSGMNFNLCNRGATAQAYIGKVVPKEVTYTGVLVNVVNPSFIINFMDKGGNNIIINKYNSGF